MAIAVRRVEEDTAQAWRRRKKLMLGDKRKAPGDEQVFGPFLTRIDQNRVSRPGDKNTR